MSLEKTLWRAVSTETLQSPSLTDAPAYFSSSMRFFILLSLIGAIVRVAASKDAFAFQARCPISLPHTTLVVTHCRLAS